MFLVYAFDEAGKIRPFDKGQFWLTGNASIQ
jgi:hypothetical protein